MGLLSMGRHFRLGISKNRDILGKKRRDEIAQQQRRKEKSLLGYLQADTSGKEKNLCLRK